MPRKPAPADLLQRTLCFKNESIPFFEPRQLRQQHRDVALNDAPKRIVVDTQITVDQTITRSDDLAPRDVGRAVTQKEPNPARHAGATPDAAPSLLPGQLRSQTNLPDKTRRRNNAPMWPPRRMKRECRYRLHRWPHRAQSSRTARAPSRRSAWRVRACAASTGSVRGSGSRWRMRPVLICVLFLIDGCSGNRCGTGPGTANRSPASANIHALACDLFTLLSARIPVP